MKNTFASFILKWLYDFKGGSCKECSSDSTICTNGVENTSNEQELCKESFYATPGRL